MRSQLRVPLICAFVLPLATLLQPARFGACAFSQVIHADHVTVRLGSEEGLQGLYQDLTNLGLTITLRPRQRSNGSSSALVHLGVFGFELIWRKEYQNAKPHYSSVFFTGPDLRGTFSSLQSRGISFDRERVERPREDGKSVGWTIFRIPSLRTAETGLNFWGEYSDLLQADLQEQRRRRERTAKLPVGPLQLIDVAEIALALPGGDSRRESIVELLSFLHPRAGVDPAAGPAIRLIEGDRYIIDSLTVRVKSREAAERYIREHNITFGGLKIVLQAYSGK
ncbi:MAG: hypothetical protein JNN08_22670 [Bryobacterales bacterium]|nr:hypothetical protein [Bryobacterales bacterium]